MYWVSVIEGRPVKEDKLLEGWVTNSILNARLSRDGLNGDWGLFKDKTLN